MYVHARQNISIKILNLKHFSFFMYNNVCKLYKVHARQNILIQIWNTLIIFKFTSKNSGSRAYICFTLSAWTWLAFLEQVLYLS